MPSGELRADYDLVVYGATSGGCVAAIAAAGAGMRVALADPGEHVGGMVSGGLARTDIERQEHLVGGLASEVFTRIGRHYDSGRVWRFEPRIAERVLREWLDESGVALLPGWRLADVAKADGRIQALESADGAPLAAPCYIDASYEGDLLPAAGVGYETGRDGRSRYGEPLAGRAEMLPNPHQFSVPVSAHDPDTGLLPYVQPYEAVGPPGHGDGKLQSYCHRVWLTDDPSRRLPLPEPDGYDPDRYLLVRRYLSALGDDACLRHFMGVGRLPGGKADINSGGPGIHEPARGELGVPGGGRRTPDGDRRGASRLDPGAAVLPRQRPSVPARLRADMAGFGLPADEFVDTAHWPPQLYVRDARRMSGEHVLTQADLEGDRSRHAYDAIGMGGYNIDVREVQWVAAPVYRFPDVARLQALLRSQGQVLPGS